MKPFSIFLAFTLLMGFAVGCLNSQAIDSSAQPVRTAPAASTASYFPLAQGAYWIYEGPVKWTIPDSSQVVEKNIRWKMEVLGVFQRYDVIGYEIEGAPWDLAWYAEGKEPGSFAIIQVGAGSFYKTTVDVLTRLADPSDVLTDLVKESEIILDIPLIPGKRFCDASSIARTDGYYCWIVGEESKIDLSSITGIQEESQAIQYPVAQYTLPDHSLIHFTPGVGITRYTYVHYGTVSECDVRLVEYHAGVVISQ